MGKPVWMLSLVLCATLALDVEEGTTRPDFGRTKYWKYYANEANNFGFSEQTDIVAKHNDLRSKLGAAYMNHMEWDEQLADKAKAIANEYKHGNESIFRAVNTYLGTKKDPATVFEAWINNVGTCENPEDNCTYQQVMDPKVKKLGCAWKQCLDGNPSIPSYLVICQYDVKYGKGEEADVSGSPCSKCKEEAPACFRNLCISKERCANAKFSDECECRLECDEDFVLDQDRCRCVDIRELGDSRIAGAEGIHFQKQGNKTEPVKPVDTTTMTDMPATMDMETTVASAEEKKSESTHAFPATSCFTGALTVWLLYCVTSN